MRRYLVATVLVALGVACADSPTGPSTTLTLTCPVASVAQTTTGSAQVTYPAPAVTGGQAPVLTTCTPESGSTFPVGTTLVSCTATDARSQTATCRTTITVTRIPQLEATRFVAFGDSITAGEVTVPVPTTLDRTPSLPLVVVPSASYPSQLLPQLQGRYTAQGSQIVMVNAGRSGESVIQGVPRLGQILANGEHEVLLLLDGYNDLLGQGAAAIPRVSLALDLMAREARARGLRVYLAQLTPPIPGRQRSIPDAVIREANEEIRLIAAGEGAVLVDLYTALASDLTRYIGVDGLHPTEAGYKRMADTFYSRIRETLETR